MPLVPPTLLARVRYARYPHARESLHQSIAAIMVGRDPIPINPQSAYVPSSRELYSSATAVLVDASIVFRSLPNNAPAARSTSSSRVHIFLLEFVSSDIR